MITRRTLDRKWSPDERDHNWTVAKRLTLPPSRLKSRLWADNEWWGDQLDTPQCVGYAWAHWIEDGPVTHRGVAPILPPTRIYEGAQLSDEWEGEGYDGTSVRGAAKWLKAQGYISSYLWAFDVASIIQVLLTRGPMVVGTNWYDGMFTPSPSGVISPWGEVAGGHAYVLNGVDTRAQRFRIKNSWGKGWGVGGHAWISFTNFARLLAEDGEACIAIEKSDTQWPRN